MTGHATFRGGSRSGRRTFENPTVIVKVLMSRAEREQLRTAARAADKSLSRYTRDRLFGMAGAAPSRTQLEALQTELQTISRQIIGEATNINQIAHHANSTHSFPEEADELREQLYAQVELLSELHERLEAWK